MLFFSSQSPINSSSCFPKSSTANLRIFKKSSFGIGFLNNLNMVSCCSFNWVSNVVAINKFTKNKVKEKKVHQRIIVPVFIIKMVGKSQKPLQIRYSPKFHGSEKTPYIASVSQKQRFLAP